MWVLETIAGAIVRGRYNCVCMLVFQEKKKKKESDLILNCQFVLEYERTQ